MVQSSVFFFRFLDESCLWKCHYLMKTEVSLLFDFNKCKCQRQARQRTKRAVVWLLFPLFCIMSRRSSVNLSVYVGCSWASWGCAQSNVVLLQVDRQRLARAKRVIAAVDEAAAYNIWVASFEQKRRISTYLDVESECCAPLFIFWGNVGKALRFSSF